MLLGVSAIWKVVVRRESLWYFLVTKFVQLVCFTSSRLKETKYTCKSITKNKFVKGSIWNSAFLGTCKSE